jgi:hypothetical protein
VKEDEEAEKSAELSAEKFTCLLCIPNSSSQEHT